MSFQLAMSYLGYITVFLGLVGNSSLVLIFSQLKIFRRHQAAFYLSIGSIIDSLQLISSTLTRSTATIFDADPTRTSLIWCKFRGYIAAVSGGTSMYIICLAAIDQYLSTNAHVRLRQLSGFYCAQYSSMFLVIISLFYSIPFLIFTEIRSNTGCNTYDVKFNYFYSFVHFSFLAGLLPLVIASSFSLFAYRNVRRIVRRQISLIRRRLDRQLTAMILVRVFLLIVTSLPFLSIRIYQMNSSVRSNEIEQILRTVAATTYSFNYAFAFYIFLVFSHRFRRQLKMFLAKKILFKCFRINRIKPEHQLTTTMPSSASSLDFE